MSDLGNKNERNKEWFEIQTNKADYECGSCGECFNQAKILKAHIDSVHKEHKDYSCEFCDESFYHAYHLQSHVKKDHEGFKLGIAFFPVFNFP